MEASNYKWGDEVRKENVWDGNKEGVGCGVRCTGGHSRGQGEGGLSNKGSQKGYVDVHSTVHV